ncbi:MAG TPA: c-type cytochrome [Thermoanaerobaculia bacterium]|nr:c-type cytochrome [Thermoanaerobaculia bacterium]
MKPLIFALIVFLGCTTTATAPQQQAAAGTTNSEFKNLQIFPKDIPRDELIAAMRSFTRALGVRCNHCHVVTATEPKEVLDFPADTKAEKRVARVMLQMTQQINDAWMDRVEQAEGHPAEPGENEMRVVCWTCHRGKTEPEMPPPPPAPQAAPGMR